MCENNKKLQLKFTNSQLVLCDKTNYTYSNDLGHTFGLFGIL